MEQMSLYATPADVLSRNNPFIGRVKLTWNAIDTRTQSTQDPNFVKRNTPMTGKRVVVAPMTRFSFYVFSFDDSRPPGAIRLGKKRSPCRVRYTEISTPIARRVAETFAPSHLVNPLDVSGKIEAFNVISIPPHILLRNARLRNDYVILHAEGRSYHVVHVPKRVLARIEVI